MPSVLLRSFRAADAGWYHDTNSTRRCLAAVHPVGHTFAMFCVSETEAAAIRTTFEQRGELSAVVELRRMFRGIDDTRWARELVRTIAGWKPLLMPSVGRPNWTQQSPSVPNGSLRSGI